MSFSVLHVVPCGGFGVQVHLPASIIISTFILLVDEALAELVELLDFFDMFCDESSVEVDFVIWGYKDKFCLFIFLVTM